MSREQFYFLVALGVLVGGSHTGDPYDDFQMLRYEDNKRRGYILSLRSRRLVDSWSALDCFRRTFRGNGFVLNNGSFSIVTCRNWPRDSDVTRSTRN